MKSRFRYWIPFGIGLAASLLLAGVNLGIVSWAESFDHALKLFWSDRWLVIPILLGFGIQAALYSILKLHLHIPPVGSITHLDHAKGTGASMGAGGASSTIAMVACCAHHVTDLLPILGLTAAATFLARYQTAFMAAGLATNLLGITVITRILLRERKAAIKMSVVGSSLQEKIA